jgi:hypothetical protein
MDIDNNVIIFMCLGLMHGKLDESKTFFLMNNQYFMDSLWVSFMVCEVQIL